MDPIIEKVLITLIGLIVGALFGWISKTHNRYNELSHNAENQELTQSIMGEVNTQIKGMEAGFQKANDQLNTSINELKSRFDNLDHVIDVRIDPLRKDMQDLQKIVEDHIGRDEELADGFVANYRFKLMRLCRMYLNQRYMTQDQFDQISELYRLYHNVLNGNGQGAEYYNKVKQEVRIVSEDELHRILVKKTHSSITPVQEADETDTF